MNREQVPDNFIVLGYIARAHGVHGAVVVVTHTEDPDTILETEHLELLSPDGQKRLPVPSFKGKAASQGLIIKLKNVVSREAAMALKGWRLGLDRRYLPEAGEDEVYLADLVGLEVQSVQGLIIGRVTALMEAGSGLILVVKNDEKPEQEILLPFHEEILVSLNLADGRLVLDPPSGLLDL